jgi:hypothetical protein
MIEVGVMLSSVTLYNFLGINAVYVISVLLVAGIILNLSLFFSNYKLYPKAIYIAIVPVLFMYFLT